MIIPANPAAHHTKLNISKAMMVAKIQNFKVGKKFNFEYEISLKVNISFQANHTRHGRQSALGNSLESPSISLCSDVTITTDRVPPSQHRTQENSEFVDIFVPKVVNVEECLI